MIFSRHTQHIVDALRKASSDEVSMPIVMCMHNGWFIGQVQRNSALEGMLMPYSKLTNYMTQQDAIALWNEEYTNTAVH